jgi:predicted metal-dependent hydrolase
LDDIPVEVTRGDVRHIRITVSPPDGRVRIAAPRHTSLDEISELAARRLDWVRRQQIRMRERGRAQHRDYVDGECHYVWGDPHTLEVVEGRARPGIHLDGAVVRLTVRPGSDRAARERIVLRWHHRIVEEAASALVEAYEPLLGVQVAGVQVRRMKTRWGSCTPSKATIRVNSDLATRPPSCLHYVVVHEMLHMLEPGHGPRFWALMDEVLPDWKKTRSLLRENPPSA